MIAKQVIPVFMDDGLRSLTRIRRENPAFNYGFFRPNPAWLLRHHSTKAESWKLALAGSAT
jgi:hypothetical protein